jgi:catechol 2,3-dioxygenase-like lactoylglutathione lyase family enzyme
MILSMHHSGFVVQNLENMRDFYRDVLGLSVLWERTGVPEYTSRVMGIPGAQTRGVMLETPGGAQRLELLKFERPERPDTHTRDIGPGSAHVCFLVKDLQQVYDDLSQRGVPFIHPPVALQMDIGLIKGCYARDPEGNWLEFLEIDESRREAAGQ